MNAFLFRCEAFSTYPRSYDLLHASYLFSHYHDRDDNCLLEDIMLEMDRMLRPQVVSTCLLSYFLHFCHQFYLLELFNHPSEF